MADIIICVLQKDFKKKLLLAEQIEDKIAVLKLAFAEQFPYTREKALEHQKCPYLSIA